MKLAIFSLALMMNFTAAHADTPELNVSPSVKAFINENPDPSQYKASCPTIDVCKSFHHHVKKYRLKGDAKDLFSKLISRSGKESWNGSSEFQLAYLPDSKLTLTKEEENQPAVGEGHIYILDLKISNKVQIPVAFQIVELNRETNTLAFSYLVQNKSNGIQHIQFQQEGDETIIVHQTYFKSDSRFRDALLYRPFHTKLLNEFYENFANHFGLEID